MKQSKILRIAPLLGILAFHPGHALAQAGNLLRIVPTCGATQLYKADGNGQFGPGTVDYFGLTCTPASSGGGGAGSTGSVTAAGTNGSVAQAVQGINGGVPVAITWTGVQPVNNTQINGTAITTGSGASGPGTQRTILATDQPAIPVTGTFFQSTQPVSGAVTANQGTAGASPWPVTESAANLATSQGTATTTSGQICPARAGRRAITLTNLGTTDVWYGASGVTTTTGGLLLGTKGSAVTLNTSAAVFGVVASGSQAVACIETY